MRRLRTYIMILPLEKLPRIAIMMAAQSSAGAFHLLAPVCSSWTRISRGTSWRTFINCFGDLTSAWVRDANKMVSRPGKNKTYRTSIIFSVWHHVLLVEASGDPTDFLGYPLYFCGRAARGVNRCLPEPSQIQLASQPDLCSSLTATINYISHHPPHTKFYIYQPSFLRSGGIASGWCTTEAKVLSGLACGRTGKRWLLDLSSP